MNKTWEKPKLIVLFKGRPEESVLATCKGDGSASSLNIRNGRCYQNPATPCGGPCNNVAAS